VEYLARLVEIQPALPFKEETVMELECKVCHKKPEELEEYIEYGKDAGLSPFEYCWQEEGTLNRHTGLFYCTDCYIKIGMPLGTA
jgi:hypothetical protein